MTDRIEDCDGFAATLEAVYHEVRLHSPQGVDLVEESLRSKLEPNASRSPPTYCARWRSSTARICSDASGFATPGRCGWIV